ncbi:unnamed protein product [Brachionus calyciflorus]|uniref:Uncharacterized protein n=1 Tax=Brachionus calyciflorus TaxID=104777 RepID=A0A813XLW8_9BILA|nr:unnamed protein product [Brachionus calyciflorus]
MTSNKLDKIQKYNCSFSDEDNFSFVPQNQFSKLSLKERSNNQKDSVNKVDLIEKDFSLEIIQTENENELEQVKDEAFELSCKLKKYKENFFIIQEKYDDLKKKFEFSDNSKKTIKDIESLESLKTKENSLDETVKNEKFVLEENFIFEKKGFINEDKKKNLKFLATNFQTRTRDGSYYNDSDSSVENSGSEAINFSKEDLKATRFFKKDGTPNMRYKENRTRQKANISESCDKNKKEKRKLNSVLTVTLPHKPQN